MPEPSNQQVMRNLLSLARCDELHNYSRRRKTLSEMLFGVRSVRNVPCVVCGRKISHFPCGENDFPLEKGHSRSCSEHPRNKHSEEWKASGRK
jgi:hypothetical protein